MSLRTATLVGLIVAGAASFGAGAAQSPVQAVRAVSYRAEQARSGQAVFDRSCRRCHTVDSAAAATAPGESIPLTGASFLSKWRTVGDLFSKTRSTMPLDAQGRLSISDTVDVVAFMLRANGVRAGSTALPGNLEQLHGLMLDRSAPGEPTANDLRTGRFYTEAQAKRGEAYFLGQCATCHSSSPAPPTPADLAMGRRGTLLGTEERIIPMATGAARWRRYPDVYALFNRIRRTMPAPDPGALSLQTYLDLTAYMLKINGAPAGEEELVHNEHSMKSMMMNEPGFEHLFNGKDLTGIKLVVGMNCRVAEAGCDQQEPGRPFKVENGIIMTTGKGQGYWYRDAKYYNFTLRFDVRFVLPTDVPEPRDYVANSGYFLFVTEHQVWPRMLQMEGGFNSLLTPAPLGGKADFSVDQDARLRAIKPINEWNSVEIVSKGGQVTASLNNALVATVRSHSFQEPGYIGFQSEGAEIHWRNIRIRAE